MALSRFPRTSAVLLAATLVATSSAIEFGGEKDATQTAGTVAPGGETPATTGANGFGNVDSPTQWTASSSNSVPTTVSSGSGGWSPPATDSPTVYSAGSGLSSGSGGWSQPTATDAPSELTPTSGQASGMGGQGWTPPTSAMSSGTGDQSWTPPSSGTGSQDWTPPSSGTGSQDWTPPTSGISSGTGDQGGLSLECSGSEDTETPYTGLSLECSGSDDTDVVESGMSLECSGSDEGFGPGTDFSLECSGSDESAPTVSTSTASSSNSVPTATTAPTTSSGSGGQTWSQPSSTASSSNTATSAASGEYEESTPATSTASSTASSGAVDQGSSQTTQIPSTASSSDTASSSTTASSANTASSATQEGSDTTQQSTSTGEHASFGTITSKSGECVIGNPDKYISTADVDWVYEHRMGENQTGNHNWIFDHIVANKGSLNYCVRWDSTEKLTKTVASKFQAMLERQYAAWNRWLIGYGCWPYDEIKVNMVGFAVKEAGLLDWTDDSLGTIYAGDLDAEGVPQCPQTCYRFFDNAPKTWSDTSACKGEPFDLSLWPKQGLEGGFGYDWGQEVNLENMLQTIDEEQLVIVAHEIGHGFGLPDFYEEADKPNADFPVAIMMAGSSMTITDSDGWMLRRGYEHIRDRYNFK